MDLRQIFFFEDDVLIKLNYTKNRLKKKSLVN